MNITAVPTFDKGLQTLCNLKSLFYQIEQDGGKKPKKFHHLISNPHYEYKEMIQRQHKTIQTLDSSNAEAAKIQQIWNHFYNQLSHPTPDIQTLYEQKIELQKWIESYKTPIKLLPSFSKLFSHSPLVILDNNSSVALHETPNAIKEYEINNIQHLYNSFESILKINGHNKFKAKVKRQIATLLSYPEGRRQISAILHVIKQLPAPVFLHLSLGEFTYYRRDYLGKNTEGNKVFQHSIFLSDQLEPGVLLDADNGCKKSRYSYTEIPLFHELQHFLNHLISNGPSQKTSLNLNWNDYSYSIEEGRTIEGSPSQGFLSENSFRSNLGRLRRYGHFVGCDPAAAPIDNLKLAIEKNISEDFDWIVPSLSIIRVEMEIENQKNQLRKQFTNPIEIENFRVLQKTVQSIIDSVVNKFKTCVQNPTSTVDSFKEKYLEGILEIGMKACSFLVKPEHREWFRGIYTLQLFVNLQEIQASQKIQSPVSAEISTQAAKQTEPKRQKVFSVPLDSAQILPSLNTGIHMPHTASTASAVPGDLNQPVTPPSLQADNLINTNKENSQVSFRCKRKLIF